MPPTSVKAQSTTDETADITWVAPDDDGGSALTGYTITATRVSTGDTNNTSAAAGATGVSVTSLIPGELYNFVVVASNAQGSSEPSNTSQTLIAGTPITHGEQISAADTGVRTGVVLTDMGNYTTTQANEVHVGQRFTYLNIKHAGCVFIDCEILYTDILYAVRISGTYDPLPRLEFCTIDAGSGSSSVSGVATGGVQMYRCKILRGINSVFLNGPSTVEECYFTGLYHPEGAHSDCFQVTNNGGTYTKITRCKFLAFDTDGADGYDISAQANSSIQVGSLSGPVLNLDVTDCYFDGGNYTCSHNNTKNGTYGDPTGIWRGNKFGRNYRYGPLNRIAEYFDLDNSNVYADTGLPVTG